MMVYDTRDFWDIGLCLLSVMLKCYFSGDEQVQKPSNPNWNKKIAPTFVMFLPWSSLHFRNTVDDLGLMFYYSRIEYRTEKLKC
jgi:hypothetical protein